MCTMGQTAEQVQQALASIVWAFSPADSSDDCRRLLRAQRRERAVVKPTLHDYRRCGSTHAGFLGHHVVALTTSATGAQFGMLIA